MNKVSFFIEGQGIDAYDKADFLYFKIMKSARPLFQLGTTGYAVLDPTEVPKTDTNTNLFSSLGLVGNKARRTEIIRFDYGYDGEMLLEDGFIRFLSTDEKNYMFAGVEGHINFTLAVDDKTMGDLDLSEIDHRKNWDSVERSIEEDLPYRYALADFGGKLIVSDPNDASNDVYNIDYLVPGVKLSYLWDKVMDMAGFTYSGNIFSHSDFKDAWLSYPKAPEYDPDTDNLTCSLTKGVAISDERERLSSNSWVFPELYSWDTKTGEGTLTDNWVYKVENSGLYKLELKPKGMAVYSSTLYKNSYVFEVLTPKGTFSVFSRLTDWEEDDESNTVMIDLNAGDELNFRIKAFESYLWGVPTRIEVNSLEFNIYESSQGIIDFTEVLKEINIKDFFLEIMNRYALTPIYDNKNRHIDFFTIEERLNGGKINFTNKYVRKTLEKYGSDDMRRNNYMTHKYNDGDSPVFDGNLRVPDMTMLDSQVVYDSKIYAHSYESTEINLGGSKFFLPQMPIWKTEIKEKKDETNIEYKGLSGRYYIYKIENSGKSALFRSEHLDSEVRSLSNVPVANSKDVHFSELVPKYYNEYSRILDDIRVYYILLDMSAYDIAKFSFTNLYYFEQEGAYFMLNKFTFQPGKLVEAEFFRVNME